MDKNLRLQAEYLDTARKTALEAEKIAGEMARKVKKAENQMYDGPRKQPFVHMKLNSANSQREELLEKIENFRKSVEQVKLEDYLDFQEEGFRTFQEWFFDGLVFDVPHFTLPRMGDQIVLQGGERIKATQHNLQTAAERLKEVKEYILQGENGNETV